jgi:Zn-dependent M16 (insulinase) family peptidase
VIELSIPFKNLEYKSDIMEGLISVILPPLKTNKKEKEKHKVSDT